MDCRRIKHRLHTNSPRVVSVKGRVEICHGKNIELQKYLVLFKFFCKDDFCDEVRDSKIHEPEVVAPVPIAVRTVAAPAACGGSVLTGYP